MGVHVSSSVCDDAWSTGREILSSKLCWVQSRPAMDAKVKKGRREAIGEHCVDYGNLNIEPHALRCWFVVDTGCNVERGFSRRTT